MIIAAFVDMNGNFKYRVQGFTNCEREKNAKKPFFFLKNNRKVYCIIVSFLS